MSLPKLTSKVNTAIAIALAGVGVSLVTARSTYGLIHPSLRSLARTTTSYLSTWNCKKTHELLSELTVHRLRGQHNGGHMSGHADTVPVADVVLGTYTPKNNQISDFHSLVPVSKESLAIINTVLSGEDSRDKPDSHSHAMPSSKHGGRVPLIDGLQQNGPIVSSPRKYLSDSSCEQLKHGLNPKEVRVYPLSFSQFYSIAQDPHAEDSWMLFLYGPWNNFFGESSYSFAISKVNPSYVEVNGKQTALSELLPKGAGKVEVKVRTAPIGQTVTSSKLAKAFPFILENNNSLKSHKIIPFANNAYSLSSSVSDDHINEASAGASIPFAILGILMSLSIAALVYKLQSDYETQHSLVVAESRTDPLSKIANRRLWDEELKASELQRLNSKSQFLLVVVDLNAFKDINDSLGHEYGDQLLKKTATSLSRVLRGSKDFLARLGGGEFGLIFSASEIAPEILYDRIKKQLSKDGINAPVGIGSTSNQHGIHDAWSIADKNMYVDKKKL